MADVGEHHQRAAGDGSVELGGDVQVDGLVLVGADDGHLGAVDGTQLVRSELGQRGLQRAHLEREVGEVGAGLVLGVLGGTARQERLVDGRRGEGGVGVLGDHEAGEDKGLADVGGDGRVQEHGQRRGRAVGPPDDVVRGDAELGQLRLDVGGEHVKGEDVVAEVRAAAVAAAIDGHHLLTRVHELLDDVAKVGRVAEPAVDEDNWRAARRLVVPLGPQLHAVDGTGGRVDGRGKGRRGRERFPRAGLADGRHDTGVDGADRGEKPVQEVGRNHFEFVGGGVFGRKE